MMGRQLKQMVRLVDDLLDASRITMGKLRIHKEPVDLATVIRDTVDACRSLFEHHGHTLVVVLPPEPIVFDADPVRLTQILTNLLNNAARYTDGAGRVRLSAARDGDEIVLCVQDEGIGIPPDRLHHVFEPFVQVDTTWKRAQGGLGIGLSLVRELVELHGGRVEARSAGLGTGCEFVVRLPATVAAPVVEARVAVLHGPSRRVLVVDDNQDAADTLALLLGMSGHEVRTAHDGAMAVQLASAFRPDVILMDLGMPKMDGYEAARRIRATPHGAEPFLVALTGWGDDADRRRTREAGFDRHVVKPVDPDELERLVAELGASDEQSEPLTA